MAFDGSNAAHLSALKTEIETDGQAWVNAMIQQPDGASAGDLKWRPHSGEDSGA